MSNLKQPQASEDKLKLIISDANDFDGTPDTAQNVIVQVEYDGHPLPHSFYSLDSNELLVALNTIMDLEEASND